MDDYTRSGVLFERAVASSGHTSNGAILGYIYGSPNNPIRLHTLDVHVATSGAQSSSQLQLLSLNGSTTYATLMVGTSSVTANNTLLEARVADSVARLSTNTVLKLVQSSTDVSVAYNVRVWGSPASI